MSPEVLTNPDYLALLRAVCERPADDLPRGIIADWLDEHGEGERAEFIRVSCEFASRRGECEHPTWSEERVFGPNPCPTCRLLHRVYTLQRQHSLQWWPDSGKLIKRGLIGGTGRGFIHRYSGAFATLRRYLPELVRREPIEQVKANDRTPYGNDNDRTQMWFSYGSRPRSQPDNLPLELIARMGQKYTHFAKFICEADARAALSLALLNEARERAGMPGLTSSQPSRLLAREPA